MARGNRTRSATVRGEYTSGTGFEAGQVAPSTKYVDMDGKVTDSEPEGGGRVLVVEGDVVRPYMVAAIEAGEAPVVGGRLDNEHSPGDASRRGVAPTDDDDNGPAADAAAADDDES